MPLSTDVNLPRDHAAKYPSCCVRCGLDPANGEIRIWTHTVGWWTWILWMFGAGFSTRVPACGDCRWKIRFQRLGGVAMTFLIGFLFLSFAWPNLREFVAEPIQKWVAMGLILICLAPYLAWEVFFPPAIDITAYSKSVDYQFKDSQYANEFAELNEDAEWVNIE